MLRTCLKGPTRGLNLNPNPNLQHARIRIAGRPSSGPSAGAGASQRRFFAFPRQPLYYGQPRIRILGPTIWSLAAVAALYVGCAAFEVRSNAKLARQLREERTVFLNGPRRGPLTFAELENARATQFAQDVSAQRQAMTHSPWDLWHRLAPTESGRVLLATAGLNTGIFAVSYVPAAMQHLVHIPALSPNYTLLTSMFAHAGLLHFAVNMYGLLTFGPPIARSKTFERSGSHLAAFYLSSGILASLSHRLATALVPAQRMAAYGASLGASGAIYALVAAFAFQYPEAKLGILFLPFDFPAQQVLVGAALFDLYGTLVGFRNIRFAHAAHLGGIAIGSAYVALDGNRRIWKPTRRIVFTAMQSLNLV